MKTVEDNTPRFLRLSPGPSLGSYAVREALTASRNYFVSTAAVGAEPAGLREMLTYVEAFRAELNALLPKKAAKAKEE